jgi:hypothetical protein
MEEHSTSFWVAFLIGLALGGAIIREVLTYKSKPREEVRLMDTEKW